jgi:Phytanoyl-CoA dioxygenase (PhyH)
LISLRQGRTTRGISKALTAAETLATHGRRLEAIDVLTAANRSARSAEIERQLVHLRHDAFDEVDTGPGLAAWPPEAPDLFPGAQFVEVPAVDFTAETLRSGILRHGCLAVRGLIPPKRVAQLTDDIETAMNACSAWESDHESDIGPWFVPFETGRGPNLGPERKWVTGGGGVWTVDSPRAMFDVLEAFAEIGLDGPLAGYLGERPALSVKKWTLRRVPTTSGTNWHQDGAFLGQGIRTVNFWLALSHCGDDAPGLDVVPKRMEGILPTGTEGAIFDWSVGEGLVQQIAEDAPVLRPIFEAGDALFFDERFLHRTAVSEAMTRERYAIESWFFAPSHYPGDQLPLVF